MKFTCLYVYGTAYIHTYNEVNIRTQISNADESDDVH